MWILTVWLYRWSHRLVFSALLFIVLNCHWMLQTDIIITLWALTLVLYGLRLYIGYSSSQFTQRNVIVWQTGAYEVLLTFLLSFSFFFSWFEIVMLLGHDTQGQSQIFVLLISFSGLLLNKLFFSQLLNILKNLKWEECSHNYLPFLWKELQIVCLHLAVHPQVSRGQAFMYLSNFICCCCSCDIQFVKLH